MSNPTRKGHYHGIPRTEELWQRLHAKHPHSRLHEAPILDELWDHARKLEVDLVNCKDVYKKYPVIYRKVRMTARALGYAIAVHGTLGRDIDFVAIPWTEEAVSPRALAKALALATEGFILDGRDNPALKPHGRLAWIIHTRGEQVDLSVMPRAPVSRVERVRLRARHAWRPVVIRKRRLESFIKSKWYAVQRYMGWGQNNG